MRTGLHQDFQSTGRALLAELYWQSCTGRAVQNTNCNTVTGQNKIALEAIVWTTENVTEMVTVDMLFFWPST